MATDTPEKPAEEVEEVSTESPKGEVEVQRSFSAINEESGAPWGGGTEGLTVKVGLLGANIDNLREGCERLAGESEEIIQAIFERLGILHCRTSRIEALLGLPQWQPEEDEGRTDAPEGEETASARCLRGHLLVPEEETDGPPKQCGFCRCQRQTVFKCPSEDCYFHACQECVQKAEAEGQGAEAGPKDQAEDEAPTPQDAQGQEPTMESAEAATEGSSPSNMSEDDVQRPADPKECRSSRPATPSTASPEDATETSSGVEVDSTDGAEVLENDSQEMQEPEQPEASKPPKLPKEGNGLKARMCALEAEVRELAAYASSTAAREAAALAQEVAAACCAELQQEVMQMSAALKEEMKALGKDGEPLLQDGNQKALEEIGRCEETFHQQFADFAEAVEQQLLNNSQAVQQFIVESQEESEQRIATNVSASVVEKVEGFALRLDSLEHELPRGRVRASKSGVKMDHEAAALQYLANGFGALMKCLGLAKTTGELLGHHWPWEEVEQRIEEAWFQRGREAWHLGLPPKPDLFDFLQCQAAAARVEAAKAPRLPDRREAARLASRLVSTSPPSCTGSCGTLSYSPQSSAATDARTEAESEASPFRPRSAGMSHPGSSPNPWHGRSSKGADMAWAEEARDSRPLRATSSGAAQRFREVLLGRT